MVKKEINLILTIFFSHILSASCKNDYGIDNISYSPEKDFITAELIYKKETINISDYNINQIRNNNINLIKNLNITISLECNEIFHLKIGDKYNQRWEPPYLIDENYKNNLKNCRKRIKRSKKSTNLDDFGFKLSDNSDNAFGFSLKNPKDGEIFFDFNNNNFLFSDTLILFETFLTSDNIYGLGERSHNFKLREGIFTIWPNDTGNIVDQADGGYNLYGVQPFALHKTNNGLYVGIFSHNVNAQDFKITLNKNNLNSNKISLEQRTIGGIVDFYVFSGETPEDVIKLYHKIIGPAHLPPFWTLGWQQCRYGIRNDTYLKGIVDKYDIHKLPLDVIWTDIDYMEDYRDFTVSKSRYGGLPNLIKYAHAFDKYFVPIIDIGIPTNSSDKLYNFGIELDVFIKSNYTKQNLLNVVWPGVCVFPDWFNPNAEKFWHEGLKYLNDQIEFDGIWQDMNEPGMMLENGYARGEINSSLDPEMNEYEKIPYIPGNGNIDLVTKSLSVNALNYGDEKFMRIFNTKPLNSMMQTLNSFSYFTSIGKRPFILSRANVAGLGRYAAHWLGDNYSTFDSMRKSISGIFNYQMFGFSMTGADICGFAFDSNDELCARWHALGAFYPFSRNHNDNKAISQEPFSIGEKTLKITRKALALRYSLVRYIYSKIFLVALYGGTIFKPTFFEFYNDPNLFIADKIEDNIMLGDSFILTPVFKADEKDFKGYLPNANWNEFPSGKNVFDYNSSKIEGGDYLFSGKFDIIHLHMRGGRIIPRQETENPQVFTTNQLRRIPTELIINPDVDKNAIGDLVFDDGYKPDPIKIKDYLHLRLNFFYDMILFNVKNNFINTSEYPYKDINFSKLTLYRSDYLKNPQYIQIKLNNGDYEYAYGEITENNMLVFDFTLLKIRFDGIENMIIFHDGNTNKNDTSLEYLE